MDVVPGELRSSERLTYRPWADTDVAVMIDMYQRPEVYRFLGSSPRPVSSEDEARTRISNWNDRFGPVAGVWAVVRTDDPRDRPIGTVILVPIERTDGQASSDFEIGWHLHPEMQGRGYATEAANAVVARARAAGLPEVIAVLFPENVPSQAICERLGMRDCGTSNEWYSATLRVFRLTLDASADQPG